MKKNLIVLLIIFIPLQYTLAQPKIIAIEAKLFYNQNKELSEVKDAAGNFSENILDGTFALWNTIIGGGDAAGYSNQTIVVVTVSTNGLANKDQVIKFTATKGKKTILQQQKTFSVIDDKDSYKILFLLDNTGCDSIQIKAALLKNGAITSKMEKKINFNCGE